MKMKTSLGLCLALIVFFASDLTIRGAEAVECGPGKDKCPDAQVCLSKECKTKPEAGKVPDGGDCSETPECETGKGLVCDGGEGEKKCKKPEPKVGDTCTKVGECGGKLECDAEGDKQCRIKDDAECAPGKKECFKGSACLGKKCVKTPNDSVDEGKPCTEKEQCKKKDNEQMDCTDDKATDAEKGSKKCAVTGTKGTTCKSDDNCNRPFECHNGVCGDKEKKGVGKSCETDENCQTGLICSTMSKKCEAKPEEEKNGAPKSAQGLGMTMMMVAATLFASKSIATLGM